METYDIFERDGMWFFTHISDKDEWHGPFQTEEEARNELEAFEYDLANREAFYDDEEGL
jgi:hypothetical protein